MGEKNQTIKLSFNLAPPPPTPKKLPSKGSWTVSEFKKITYSTNVIENRNSPPPPPPKYTYWGEATKNIFV